MRNSLLKTRPSSGLPRQKRPAAAAGSSNKKPKVEKKLPLSLSVDEVEKLLSAPQGTAFQPARDRAILETLYSTGLRVSELTALNVASLDFSAEVIKARGKGSKERVVPVGSFALQAIKQSSVMGLDPMPEIKRILAFKLLYPLMIIQSCR